MNQPLTNKSPQKVKKGPFLFNRDLIILLVCTSLAVIFWILTALSKPSQSDITVLIQYENLPEDRVFSAPPTDRLKVRVVANGWDLMASYLNISSLTIPIDMSRYTEVSTISTSLIKDLIEKELHNNAVIKLISPNVLQCQQEKKIQKVVPILFHHKLTFAQQCNVSGVIKTEPDSVVVTGAKSFLDTITTWPTEEFALSNINESVSMKVALKKPPYFNSNLSVEEVDISIPVEQFTEGQIKIEIQMVSVPKDISLIIIPKKMEVTYQVALSKFEDVTKELFLATVDFSKIDILSNKKVEIKLIQQPLFIKNVNFTPSFAEYIIYK